MEDSVGVYDNAEFADNPEARCSVVLILDISGSMSGRPIETVNQALNRSQGEIYIVRVEEIGLGTAN